MLGSQNMLGTANKTFYEKKEERKSNKEKGVWIVAKKLHPHP